MTIRSGARRDAEKRERKALGAPAKGDRRAGHGKDPPPKGGRNRGGRGAGR